MNGSSKYIIAFISAFIIWQGVFPQTDSFKVGIIMYKTREAVEQTYTPLLEYLARKLDKKLKITVYENGEDLGYFLSNGQLDMGVFTPFPYLNAKNEFDELEVFASHNVNGRPNYSGCILVHKESKIDSLHKLGGKHFTFVKETSTSGYKIPLGVFEENNLDIESGFFTGYTFSGGHEESLRALLNRETDGIAIDDESLFQLSANEQNQIAPLAKYTVPYQAYVLNPQLDPEFAQKAKNIMFKAHLDPEVKGHFENNPLQITQWHPQSDQAYNSLRKYLQFVRVKPDLQFFLELMPSAKAKFEGGDQAAIIERNIINRLKKFNRFKRIGNEPIQNGHTAKLEIGLAGEKYHSILYLEDESLWENDFEESQITDKSLANNIANSLMAAIPIATQLQYRKKANMWFVNYGTNDGIDAENYHFLLDGQELPVIKINEENTIFDSSKDFKAGTSVKILYKMPENQFFTFQNATFEPEMENFWQNPDHVWGIIGLAVAILTIAFGSYFAGRKKKRFKTILYGANDILRLHLEGEENIQIKILNKREKINRSLEKGHINENQFL
ncbi:MAG: phosphate/phosphite/phosphonate ABC transporter substrate-binding protein, partial [Bacteroidetes bacterium]|nr:phosphate/phosphite/phosphonate ABC transporter substrate-binding protein [Bacteroidota bacterium]